MSKGQLENHGSRKGATTWFYGRGRADCFQKKIQDQEGRYNTPMLMLNKKTRSCRQKNKRNPNPQPRIIQPVSLLDMTQKIAFSAVGCCIKLPLIFSAGTMSRYGSLKTFFSSTVKTVLLLSPVAAMLVKPADFLSIAGESRVPSEGSAAWRVQKVVLIS